MALSLYNFRRLLGTIKYLPVMLQSLVLFVVGISICSGKAVKKAGTVGNLVQPSGERDSEYFHLL